MAPFFTSERALGARFARTARRHALAPGDDPALWQTDARQRLSRLLGIDRFEPVPPAPRLRERTVRDDGLVREEWLIEVEAQVTLPLTLLLPAGDGPRPLVLCPHGHGSGGRLAVIGERRTPELSASIDQHCYDYGVQFARAGFVAACPDARGFGERREPSLQRDASLLGSSCHHLMLAGAPLGLTVQGMWTWDLMRLLDWLVADARVDASRIGCAGLSGGGMQTLDLAALDTRVGAAVVSGYFYGARESLLECSYHCDCNLVPGLWESFDMGDVGALIAGRALLVQSGDADPLNGRSGLDNVASQIAIARAAFDALGGTLEHDVFSGGHRWDGARAIPWMAARLGG